MEVVDYRGQAAQQGTADWPRGMVIYLSQHFYWKRFHMQLWKGA